MTTPSLDREHARYHAPELGPITVTRWPSEEPLLILACLVAAVLWVVLTVTVIGVVYAIMIGLFFGIMHLGFIAYVRGSAVRLGPNQFPELYASVERLSARVGLGKVPEAYLMQAGGSLNAFATRILRSQIIVLYSDLLEACGESTAARDMIIAHELGHIRCGHLKWRWFLLPAAIVPFLMTALSRAREYTCDRYGLAGAGNVDGAALGLTILAAGAEHGPRVNRTELVRQRELMAASGLMTLGEWLGTHPPLAKRLAAIDPSLGGTIRLSRAGAMRAALGLIGVPAVGLLFGIGVMSSSIVKQFRAITDSARVAQSRARGGPYEVPAPTPPADAAERARADIANLAEFVERERARGPLPWSTRELYQRYESAHHTGALLDPYDGDMYGYDRKGDDFVLFSSGPDRESWTADDIRYDSRVRKIVSAPSDSQTSPLPAVLKPRSAR